jgi:hypothetical protein
MGMNLNNRLLIERSIHQEEFFEMVRVVVDQGRKREKKGGS